MNKIFDTLKILVQNQIQKLQGSGSLSEPEVVRARGR